MYRAFSGIIISLLILSASICRANDDVDEVVKAKIGVLLSEKGLHLDSIKVRLKIGMIPFNFIASIGYTGAGYYPSIHTYNVGFAASDAKGTSYTGFTYAVTMKCDQNKVAIDCDSIKNNPNVGFIGNEESGTWRAVTLVNDSLVGDIPTVLELNLVEVNSK